MNRFAVATLAVPATVLAMTSAVHANVEIGGTAGLHAFSDSNTLGSPEGSGVTQANSSLFGLRFGYYFSSKLGLELEGGLVPTESRGGDSKFDIWDVTARLGVVYQFRAENPANKVLPFVEAGAGMMRVVKLGTTDMSLFNLSTGGLAFVGVGAKYRASGAWGVRVDLRFMTPTSPFAADFEGLLSLYREFGRQAAPLDISKPKQEKDSDGDGIADSVDKCPNEAEDKDGFQDEDGCPDKDNDNDGIADANDKCPDQAEDKDGFQDDDGCPDPDNDNDGVADANDKCPEQPETRNGYQDDDGCPDELPKQLAKYTGTIQGINFKVNSADLLPASNKTLDKAVAVLNEFKDVKLEIQGHTDDQPLTAGGKFADNDALSQARAETVKAYFVKKGITEDRVTAKGYGATVPVTDPTGLKGAKLTAARAANRRVEFKLVSPGGEAAPPEAKPEDKKPEGSEPPKADAPKADDKKAAPKADAPKADDKKAAPKADATKAEPKADAPKADAPKADAKKPDKKPEDKK